MHVHETLTVRSLGKTVMIPVDCNALRCMLLVQVDWTNNNTTCSELFRNCTTCIMHPPLMYRTLGCTYWMVYTSIRVLNTVSGTGGVSSERIRLIAWREVIQTPAAETYAFEQWLRCAQLSCTCPMDVCEYEEERRERILRNERILQGLGLGGSEHAAASLTTPRAARRSREKGSAAEENVDDNVSAFPARRSGRLRGEKAPLAELHKGAEAAVRHSSRCVGDPRRGCREGLGLGGQPLGLPHAASGPCQHLLGYPDLSCADRRPSLSRTVDEDELDALNLHRIRSMSEAALKRRIWKIKRQDKMRSFVKVCEGAGGGGRGGCVLGASSDRGNTEFCGVQHIVVLRSMEGPIPDGACVGEDMSHRLLSRATHRTHRPGA